MYHVHHYDSVLTKRLLERLYLGSTTVTRDTVAQGQVHPRYSTVQSSIVSTYSHGIPPLGKARSPSPTRPTAHCPPAGLITPTIIMIVILPSLHIINYYVVPPYCIPHHHFINRPNVALVWLPGRSRRHVADPDGHAAGWGRERGARATTRGK